MSEALIIAIIGAVPATCSFLLTAFVVHHAWHIPHRIERLQKQTKEIADHTNSLTEKLLDTTATIALAQGIQQEKDRVAEGADDAAVVAEKLIATAAAAADKLLSAAQINKEKEGR